MNINPYHFLLLKRLITLEVELFHKKKKTTYEDLRIYIETLRLDYSGKSPTRYAEFVIKRIWGKKDIFSFKESTLDELCRLLVVTRKFDSWFEFCTVHENHFAQIGDIYTYAPYFRLTDDEKEKIDLFVDETVGLYKFKGLKNEEAIIGSYNFKEIIASSVEEHPNRYDKSNIQAAYDFIGRNMKIIRSSLFILMISTELYFNSDWKTILFSSFIFMLFFIQLDLIVLYLQIIKTTKGNFLRNCFKYRYWLLFFIMGCLIFKFFPYGALTLFKEGFSQQFIADFGSKDNNFLITSKMSFRYPSILTYKLVFIEIKAKDEKEYYFLKQLRLLGSSEYSMEISDAPSTAARESRLN